MSKIKCFLLAIGLFMLSGCNSAPSDSTSSQSERLPVRLTVWCREDETEIVSELCEDYARKNSDKRFAFMLSAMTDKMAAEMLISGADKADVFCFSVAELPVLAEAGMLYELGIDSSAASPAGFSGKLYGYPVSVDCPVLYYDRSKLSDSDILTVEGILDRGRLAANLCDADCQAGFFAGAGCGIFGKGCGVNSDNGALAAEYLLSLTKNDSFQPVYSEHEIKSGFADRTLAAAIAGLSAAPEIKSSLGSAFGTAVLPAFELPDGSPARLMSAANYRIVGVNPSSENIDEAQRFAAALAGAEMQKLRLTRLGEIPADIALCIDDEISGNYRELVTLTEQLSYSAEDISEGFKSCAPDFGNDLLNGEITLNNLRERLSRFTEIALIS